MVGSPKFPRNCTMWYGYRIGIFYSNNIYSSSYNELQKVTVHTNVEAIDGFLMATQYDFSGMKTYLLGGISTMYHKALNLEKLDII